MRDISIKSVLLATLAVLGIDFLSEATLLGVYGGLPDKPTDEQIRATIAALYENPRYLTWSLILGMASIALGGYLAARMAQRLPYFNALAFGLFYSVLGAIIAAMGPVAPPGWLRTLVPVLTVAAALGGAWLCRKTSES